MKLAEKSDQENFDATKPEKLNVILQSYRVEVIYSMVLLGETKSLKNRARDVQRLLWYAETNKPEMQTHIYPHMRYFRR